MRAYRTISSFGLLALVGATIMLGSWGASAAACLETVVVYDAGDSASPTRGQLRTAIAEVCTGGTILLRPGIVIGLEQGELVIPSQKTLTIMNPSQGEPTAVVIDAHGVSRVISVQAGADLTLSNVIVRGGSGAGINNEGSLTMAGGRVTGNTGFGVSNIGKVTLNDDAAITANQGAGIFNGLSNTYPFAAGQLTLNDESSISGNVGSSGGGIANGGVVTLNDNSSVSGNVATRGGGIFNAWSLFSAGSVTLNERSAISGNEAELG